MMRLLTTVLLLASVSVAAAQSTLSITGTDGATMSAVRMPPTYTYEPKPDITAPELSQVVAVLLPALSCRHYFDDCGVVKRIEALPPEIKRHFVRHE